MECNEKIYNENKQNGFKTKAIRNQSVKPGLSYIADSLEGMFKHYWLSDGTLLGWYRDCGIIPYTQDSDIAVPVDEYDKSVKEHFLGNPSVILWLTMGSLKDSFEIRLRDKRYGFHFDIFLMYPLNETFMYHGTQGTKYKYRLVKLFFLNSIY